ncbi:WG repeat-containing protein [Oceanirhabdus seepicola]|uniref:WG repeat-containing protein n=1 Tax=Oceanirhabdus seepicola TaxID=2828781 RepID=A0A9J6NZ70_9CLOT|nr:WG repeat-containing protein [Oceanirhabdus seepicola]MCM1989831.1 WG repeat-containing protein [Oceanirhabdus seepicola]
MKKLFKLITFTLILLLFTSFISCSSTQSKSRTLDTLSLKEGTLVAPARFNGKWGVMTSSGEWVFDPTSDITALRDFHEGLALACNKCQEWGYINPYGEWVIKPKFEFNESDYEPSDSTNFNDGRALLKETGKDYGYIDKSGDYVIEPQFDWASPFNEGVATFLHRKNNIFYEFINPNGEILLIIEDQNSFEMVSDFSEDLIAKENDNGKMGFINIYG